MTQTYLCFSFKKLKRACTQSTKAWLPRLASSMAKYVTKRNRTTDPTNYLRECSIFQKKFLWLEPSSRGHNMKKNSSYKSALAMRIKCTKMERESASKNNIELFSLWFRYKVVQRYWCLVPCCTFSKIPASSFKQELHFWNTWLFTFHAELYGSIEPIYSFFRSARFSH